MGDDLVNGTLSFSKQMRKATRDIHKISDALVNAKIAFGLSDNKVWADGLQIFYEIFRFLERNTPVEWLPVEYHRTTAFESDLAYYLGDDWQSTYSIRESVHKYLNHLEEIKNKNEKLLIAYVYHLYMGLLSGGQILQKKRQLMSNIITSGNNGGCAVTRFEGYAISDLKKRMRGLVDDLGIEWDEEIKSEIIKESRRVFELNNEILSTVEGAGRVALFKIGIAALVVVAAYVIFLVVK
ncbi:hypothetical protein HA402_015496 [Bradysia odoriphaga]|nr:hypothetical protein HA402_015496 [Bradysia odoriphaga]